MIVIRKEELLRGRFSFSFFLGIGINAFTAGSSKKSKYEFPLIDIPKDELKRYINIIKKSKIPVPNHISSMLGGGSFPVNGILSYIIKVFYLGMWRRGCPDEDDMKEMIPVYFQELFVSLYSTYILFLSHDSPVKKELYEMRKPLLLAIDFLNTSSEEKLPENFLTADTWKIFKHFFYSGKLLCYFQKTDYIQKLCAEKKHKLHA